MRAIGIKRNRWALPALIVVAWSASPAFAGGSDMPWEGPLTEIVDSVTGPVAQAIGVLAIVALGFGFAFSEGGTTLRRVLGVVLGLSIAFAAASFGLSFFGFAGGLTY